VSVDQSVRDVRSLAVKPERTDLKWRAVWERDCACEINLLLVKY
jgi:hypothetical protein